MARAGQQMVQDDDGGLADRISVGVLAKAFPRELVESVIEAARAREQRRRMLPAWVVVYYVLALALFMDMGGARVMRKLSGTLAWAARGVTVAIPSEQALSTARARLGPTPLRLLFEDVAGPLAGPGTTGAFWRGLRVTSVDGTTLDVQDTGANWERFGGPSTKTEQGERLRGAFPQLRLLVLAECGTRALIAAGVGPYSSGEKTLTAALLPKLDESMLVLADRSFAGYELWRDAAATGAALVWRMGASFPLPVVDVLADGSYLSRLNVPKELVRTGARAITVRVVEYHLLDAAGEVTEAFVLATTLLDPVTAPARELAELYHQRWQIETAIGAFKSQLRGNGVVLRSKTPDGAEQECWALLCVYHAIREAICAAATLTDDDPLRLSFVNALDAVRGPVGDQAAFPPS
jgi:Insertion element 4 transposase N-terminal/Transposase DDE domain